MESIWTMREVRGKSSDGLLIKREALRSRGKYEGSLHTMRKVQREFSDQNKIAKEAFRPEGSEQKAPRLLVVCEQSPRNVVEVSRKPSDCL